MENHRMGFFRPLARAATMRASVGVISGRRATSRPPLSVKLYNCPTISSPLLAVYSSSGSSGGPSYSSKPYRVATVRQVRKIWARRARSAG
jgi:hypothetical protein